MNKKIRLMRYVGSKLFLTDHINQKIKNLNEKIYIEPYLGSGAIFLNLNKEFNEYILNDKDKNVITIWEGIKNFKYDDYINEKNFIFKKFGDIKEKKSSYYNFRDWYNDHYHFTDKKEKSIYLYFLYNSCLNSLARFGPHGFNQSYGNRFHIINKNNFNSIKSKLKRSKIYNIEALSVMKEKSIIFLDPPYFKNNNVSYNNNFKENDNIKLINFIKNFNAKILYTDVYDIDTLKRLGNNWNTYNIREMVNISATKKKNKTHENLYINFHIQNNKLF